MSTIVLRPLRRILGLGFNLALVFGTVVGVGILRLPGTVAASLGSDAYVIAAWALGGLYALMGAVAVAELAAMIPEAGGFRVYARRAFGEGVGFAVGWVDWLTSVSVIAYCAATAVTFLGALWPPVLGYPRAAALVILAATTMTHWVGLRVGSALTTCISVAVGSTLMVLVVGCFLAAPAPAAVAPLPTTAAALPFFSGAMILAAVPALRAVLTAYDGWYQPIYMAEENTDPARTLPRAIIGGTLLVAALYILMNAALLHVLPITVLTASDLPAADAARIALPQGSAMLVTAVSLLTVVSLLNNVLLGAPRILYAIGRDGLFTEQAAVVSAGGTPRTALAVTSVCVAMVLLSGSFDQIIALGTVLFLLNYITAFATLFVLRRTAPQLPRPYKAFAYPLSTAIVLLGSVAFLIAAVTEDPRSALIAAIFLAACAPAYAWTARRRRRRLARA